MNDYRSGIPPERVTIRQVATARRYMANAAFSMREAAILIGVRSSDLDIALWQYLGTDVEAILAPVDRPPPMF